MWQALRAKPRATRAPSIPAGAQGARNGVKMSAHIVGKCPHCKSDYRLRDYAAGRRARCKACKQVFVVPGKRKGSSVDDDVVAWLASAPDDEVEEEREEDEDSDASPRSMAIQPETHTHGTRPTAR